MTILKRNLIYTSRGNGIGISNRDKQKDGDYEKVAHINADREITYYETLHPDDVADIEDYAMTANPSISATQSQQVFKVFAGEQVATPLDMRDELIMLVDYTYADNSSAEITEGNIKVNLAGQYPMIDDDSPYMGVVLAKDQYGSEIEMTTCMDGQSLTNKIISMSPEAKIIQSLNGIVATIEGLPQGSKDLNIDIGGLVADKIDDIATQLPNVDGNNSHFNKDAGGLTRNIKSPPNTNIRFGGKSLSENDLFKKIEDNSKALDKSAEMTK